MSDTNWLGTGDCGDVVPSLMTPQILERITTTAINTLGYYLCGNDNLAADIDVPAILATL